MDSSLDSDHCHEDDGRDEAEIRKREKALRKIIIAAILCFLFMCGEILGKCSFTTSIPVTTSLTRPSPTRSTY